MAELSDHGCDQRSGCRSHKRRMGEKCGEPTPAQNRESKLHEDANERGEENLHRATPFWRAPTLRMTPPAAPEKILRVRLRNLRRAAAWENGGSESVFQPLAGFATCRKTCRPGRHSVSTLTLAGGLLNGIRGELDACIFVRTLGRSCGSWLDGHGSRSSGSGECGCWSSPRVSLWLLRRPALCLCPSGLLRPGMV